MCIIITIPYIVFLVRLDYYALAGDIIPLYTCATERKFKRYVLSPDTGPLQSGFFIYERHWLMDIYIYSDESGVFDKAHNRYFIFGGIVFLSKEQRDDCARKYIKAENDIKASAKMKKTQEAKASSLNNKNRIKLFRALNNQYRFGVIIDQKKVLDRIFSSKKDKQRYQDYAYKIAVKRLFQKLIREGAINPNEVETLNFYVDEHTTATNGCYELREGLEQEFRNGTYNEYFSTFYPPIFPELKIVNLHYCNSGKKTLIRAADIIANRIYYHAHNQAGYTANEDDFFVIRLP